MLVISAATCTLYAWGGVGIEESSFRTGQTFPVLLQWCFHSTLHTGLNKLAPNQTIITAPTLFGNWVPIRRTSTSNTLISGIMRGIGWAFTAWCGIIHDFIVATFCRRGSRGGQLGRFILFVSHTLLQGGVVGTTFSTLETEPWTAIIMGICWTFIANSIHFPRSFRWTGFTLSCCAVEELSIGTLLTFICFLIPEPRSITFNTCFSIKVRMTVWARAYFLLLTVTLSNRTHSALFQGFVEICVGWTCCTFYSLWHWFVFRAINTFGLLNVENFTVLAASTNSLLLIPIFG